MNNFFYTILGFFLAIYICSLVVYEDSWKIIIEKKQKESREYCEIIDLDKKL